MQPLPLALSLISLHFGRYLLTAGGAWLFFFGWKKNPLTARQRLQPTPFLAADLKRELRWSFVSAVLFGLCFAFVFAGRAPEPLTQSGGLAALEFFGWLAFIVAVHDTTFYWSHRVLHHPAVFSRVHALHHRSKNPSPFAALAFHPAEALSQVAWAVPLSLWVPIPTAAWVAFSFLAIFVNVLGHCGVEPYPLGWQRHPVLRWLNFSTLHNRHHQDFHGNYGLYFSFWDRVMGTLLQGAPSDSSAASASCRPSRVSASSSGTAP